MTNLSGPVRYLRVMLGMRTARLRESWRHADRGASAVELAVITAIILAIALALLAVIKTFVTNEQAKITGG